MEKKECTFCNIYKNNIGIIYENDLFFAQFDRFPVTPGHAEVIPKRHIASKEEMTTLESSRLTATELEVWQVIKEKIVGGDLRKIYLEFLLKPLNDISDDMCRGALNTLEKFVFTGDYNWGGNNGPYAGRTIDHLHTHIIPRFENDVPNPVGGIRWIIPGRANYKK